MANCKRLALSLMMALGGLRCGPLDEPVATENGRGAPRESARESSLASSESPRAPLHSGKRLEMAGRFVGSIGVQPRTLAAGDFDGDGDVDLVVADAIRSDIYVLLADGAFGWQPGVVLEGLYTVSTGTAVDVTLDGKLDLVLVNSTGNSVTVFRGNGAGGFTYVGKSAAGNKPVGLALGDWNGDGKLDAAVGSGKDAKVQLLIGDGTGLFKKGATIAATTAESPQALVTTDVNGDRKSDLVLAGSLAGQVTIMLGDGKGGFAAKPGLSAGASPLALVSGDLNRDGAPDLLVSNASSGSLFTLLSDGKGGLGAPIERALGGELGRLAVADFDGDGALDAAVLNIATHQIEILRGDGKGALSSIARRYVEEGPADLALNDWDGDGRLDFAITVLGRKALHLMPGLSDGTPGAVNEFPVDAYTTVEMYDVTSDGILDLMFGGGSNALTVLPGDGHGGFGSPIKSPLDRSSSLIAMAFGDVNGDGWADAVLSMEKLPEHWLQVQLGDGHGSFRALRDWAWSTDRMPLVYLADWNKDGRSDIFVKQGGWSLMVGRGDGTFASAKRLSDVPTSEFFEIRDLNVDGNLDLFTWTLPGGSVFLGDGLGGYGTALTVSGFPEGGRATLFDCDGDGYLDVFSGAKEGKGEVLFGDGSGRFPRRQAVHFPYYAHVDTGADLDGDGKFEVALGSSQKPQIGIISGAHLDLANRAMLLATPGEPAKILTGDLDNDGLVDLVALSRKSTGPLIVTAIRNLSK